MAVCKKAAYRDQYAAALQRVLTRFYNYYSRKRTPFKQV